ncbi:hypothetical protein JCM18899A_11680 [Nocardioides sp. AN3]
MGVSDDPVTRLRSLVYTGDGRGLVAMLSTGPWPEDSLQLIGDGLCAAVRAHVDGARQLAATCIDALDVREWEGDRELVEALGAALGTAPTPLLRPLPVDLEELSSILEGDPVYGGGRIDLTTGEVWPESALENARDIDEIDEDDDDPDRWLWVECEGSRAGFRDMVVFIGDVEDTRLVDRLSRAIEGRGAFRRFKDTLAELPDLLARWYAFSNDRQRGRARSWLAAEGYTPVPR